MKKGFKWDQQKLLAVSRNYWETCTLHTGVKLDVFTLLGRNSLSLEEICSQVKGDKRAVEMLLNALVAMKLLHKKDAGYTNTETASTFLVKGSPEYLGFLIMLHHNQMTSWVKMDQAVLSGKPQRVRSSFTSAEQRENFLMGMFNSAMSVAPEITEILNLKDYSHLLDFGGGPGTYAIHFCLSHPELKAKVYDLPSTRPYAEKTINSFGLSNRIGFIAGDFIREEMRHKNLFDAAWLSHIIHGEGYHDAEMIISKAVSALKPGGKIFIHEFILDNNMQGPLFPALFSLNMLLGTDEGQSYSEEQIFAMLKNQGVKHIKRLDFKGPSESGIIEGII